MSMGSTPSSCRTVFVDCETGTVPRGVSTPDIWPSLYGLNLSHNSFTGPLPLDIGTHNDSYLESLDLSANRYFPVLLLPKGCAASPLQLHHRMTAIASSIDISLLSLV